MTCVLSSLFDQTRAEAGGRENGFCGFGLAMGSGREVRGTLFLCRGAVKLNRKGVVLLRCASDLHIGTYSRHRLIIVLYIDRL